MDAIQNLEKAGFNIEKLCSYKDIAEQQYNRVTKKMRMLDAVDRGKFWQVLKDRRPIYQILPDTNFVSRVKNGLLASIYTVTKGANFSPTSKTDMSIIKNVNTFIDLVWQKSQVGYYQFMAGERAALLNLGITQVGWDTQKKEIALQNIDPLHFRRDPFAKDLQTAAYCYKIEYLHETVIMANPHYKKGFKKYKEGNKYVDSTPEVTPNHDSVINDNIGSAKNYHTIAVFWVRDEGKVHELHTIDYKEIIYAVENVQPSEFPFAMLYCNEPAGDIIGTSPCSLILPNHIVFNLMNSILFTAEYKNQRPPKFVSADSGINVPSFMRHGDEADKTYVIRGSVKDAIYYHQFPYPSPALPTQMEALAESIGNITGIDDRYTGRDTGSITTTGGTQDMLARVTLVDSPKILLYEKYTLELSRLIVYNYYKWNPSRSMFYQNPRTNRWETVEVDLDKIDIDTLMEYEINISSELPRNKQRLAMIADQLMEKQMQYAGNGTNVDLIQPEEWLYLQDLGQATEMFLERMGSQRMMDAVAVTSQVVSNYEQLMASGNMDMEQAILETANTLEQTRQGTSAQDVVPGEQAPITPQTGSPVL